MTVTDQPWKRVVTPGSFTEPWWHNGQRDIQVFVEITYQFERNQKWELSITGVEGPKANGDAVGSCGQVCSHLTITKYGRDWNWTMVDKLVATWDRWHLNGMRAGSPDQEDFLRESPYDRERDDNHYDWARRVLGEAGLNPSPEFNHPTRTVEHVTVSAAHGVVKTQVPQPYEYGHAWMYEEVPADVLQWLYDLPVASRAHPWGDSDQWISDSDPSNRVFS